MLGQAMGRRLDNYVPDYVVFDLETTGTSPTVDDIIEISAIRVRAGRPEAEFTSLVNPGRPIPPGATQVNGITDAMVADAPPVEEVLGGFLHFAGDDILAGHNIQSFDMKYIYRESRKYFHAIPGNDYVDTLTLSRRALPQMAHHRLTDLAEHYSIPTEGAHRALQDCRMNQAVLECLKEELKRAGTIPVRICPRCGKMMVLRRGRFGEFYGCSGYPSCRWTENA